LSSDALIEWRDLIRGDFIRKVNRFVGYVSVAGLNHYVYTPNPTPTAELLKQGAEVLLLRMSGSHKTDFRLVAARTGDL
jgi:DNA-binding sugar fermentation-stimulating protein